MPSASDFACSDSTYSEWLMKPQCSSRLRASRLSWDTPPGRPASLLPVCLLVLSSRHVGQLMLLDSEGDWGRNMVFTGELAGKLYVNYMELLTNQVSLFWRELWPSADFNKHIPFWGLGDTQHHDAELVWWNCCTSAIVIWVNFCITFKSKSLVTASNMKLIKLFTIY